MTKPVVSICIPVYNGEAYLRECLDSCVSQSYTNYEIVICDDGSTDAGPRICEEYVQRYPAIRFFKNERNLGLVANWNRCVEQARGEWIKFVFQDDYMTDDCLEKFSTCFEGQAPLIVSKRHFLLPENASPDYVDYYTRQVRTLENTSMHRHAFFPPRLISRIAVQNISMNFIGEPSLTCFRKNVVQEIGAFNPVLKQICDLEFFLRVGSKYGLTYLPDKVCAFRIHSESTTSTNVETKYFELHYIEPLLFSWCLLYGSAYADFRAHLHVLQRQKLKLYFRLKAYAAYREDQKRNYRHYLFAEASHPFKEVFDARKGTVFLGLLLELRK